MNGKPKAPESLKSAQELIPVRIVNEYQQSQEDPKLPNLIHKKGTLLSVPLSEITRAPWCFKRIDEDEKEKAAAIKPKVDPWFEQAKLGQQQAFEAQKLSHALRTQNEIDRQQEVLKSIPGYLKKD